MSVNEGKHLPPIFSKAGRIIGWGKKPELGRECLCWKSWAVSTGLARCERCHGPGGPFEERISGTAEGGGSPVSQVQNDG